MSAWSNHTVVPAPLAKFLQFEIDAKMNPVDALMHILQTMRKQAQKVLVIAEDENALNSAAEGMNMAKVEYRSLGRNRSAFGRCAVLCGEIQHHGAREQYLLSAVQLPQSRTSARFAFGRNFCFATRWRILE